MKKSMTIPEPEDDITIKFRISVDDNETEQEEIELEEELEKISKDIGVLRLLTVFCLGWMIGG